MKCVKCPNDASFGFDDCKECYDKFQADSRKQYNESKFKETICIRCNCKKIGTYHWCIDCYKVWCYNGNSFPEDKIPQKCMIMDSDDEEVIPTAKKVLNIKKVVKSEFERSDKCNFRCCYSMDYGSCCCNSRYESLKKQNDEAYEVLKKHDGKQRVTFGKFKDQNTWERMFINDEVSSWSNWYINNCSNKGDFYHYLVALKTKINTCDLMHRIANPHYD